MRKLTEKIFASLGYEKVTIDKEYDYYRNQPNNSFYIVAFFDNFEDIQSDKGWEATELDALDTKIVGDR